MLIDARRDHIRRLRAVGAARDPLALRLRLERSLGASQLRPSGLPPGAILCVRRLRVVMPRCRGEVWAGLEREVQDLLPGIARPFREAVPANAQAVLFSDEAEMLACMTRDWWRGAADAWWWRGLLGEAPSEVRVRRALIDAPMFVPAAVELLARVSLATAVVGSWAESYCERLGAAVADVFAIPGWGAAVQPQPALVEVGGWRRVPQHLAPEQLARIEAALDSVPDAGNLVGLAPVQRALLGLVWVLRLEPALAPVPGLAAILRARSSSRQPPALGPPGVLDPLESGMSAELPARVAPRHHDDGPAPRLPPAARGGDTPPLRSDEPSHWPAQAALGMAISPETAADATQVSTGEVEIRTDATALLPRRDGIATSTHGIALVDSEFAGVVYLINLALYLELYGDFTQPARPGLQLPLGDFLALVGERACGPPLRNDPVWSLLAQLAGRGVDEPPAGHFVPPTDQPLMPSPDTEGRGDREREPLARWLTELTRMLEARAALALGVERGEALPYLCARRGRLALSPTRLDATFLLAEHPLAIRIAGLDRNCGWVPAAGRVVEFHYE